MPPTSPSESSIRRARQQFEDVLPAMDAAFRFAFRRRPFQEREDALAEARACAWKAWVGLLRQGKDPLAIGITGIAGFAVRHTSQGRRVGNLNRGRGTMDVFHPRAQRATGVRVIRDADVRPRDEPRGACWKDWLASDNRYGPADEACFRLDFQAWLLRLPGRKRRMAELLAEGHQTGAVARMLGVTPAAVSQARPWLAEDWRRYQGGAPSTPGEGRAALEPS